MDKLATYKTLDRIGLPCALTFEIAEWEDATRTVSFPLILKPRCADLKAVTDYKIRKIGCMEELKEAIRGMEGKENQYVVQEYLEGTELTIDFFCDRDGKVISVVPGERLSALSKAFSEDGGAIDQGRTFHDPQIEQLVCNAAQSIRYFGPANFQGYRTKNGIFKFTENNPRFTGASVMTRAAGRDFFQWSIDLISGKKISLPKEDFRDINMSSWLSPIFFNDIQMINI
jgi:carbamoyl-phosphate synthase large subunit